VTVTGDITDRAKLCCSLKSVTHKMLKVKTFKWGKSAQNMC